MRGARDQDAAGAGARQDPLGPARVRLGLVHASAISGRRHPSVGGFDHAERVLPVVVLDRAHRVDHLGLPWVDHALAPQAGGAIQLGSGLNSAGAQLWIADHGPGIPPASRHRIFRRFDRAHGKRSGGGSGLGLAIVAAIAKGHGGQCVVTDTPGGGATFTIHLPLPTAELPAPVRAGDVVLQREAAG